jgi:signal transduction histidine kinase
MRLLGRWVGPRRNRQAALLVLGGLTAFVAGVYALVVLAGGALIGHLASPHLGLSVLATAIVALGFEPVRTRLEAAAAGVVHGGRPSPYDVLSRFSEAVAGTAQDDVPTRMAAVLGEGTGAKWTQVWLVLGDELALEATWSPVADEPTDPTPPPLGGSARRDNDPVGRRTLPVRHAGELLGVLRLQEHDRQPLTPMEERLFAGLAGQAGLVLHGVRLRAELARRVAELSVRAEELQHSRERLVDTQDAERRRLERDIHDGAQQHLVALAVNLRLAHTLSTTSPERAARVLGQQQDATRATVRTLTDLSRGIYPRQLTDEGIAPALRSAVLTTRPPVQVHSDGVGRHPSDVEAAVYFCCLEAVQNATKHAGAGRVLVRLCTQGSTLVLEVSDDGAGFDPGLVPAGAGLANMRDRIDSVGGELTIGPGADGGTRVAARVPTTGVPTGQAG